MVCRGLCVLEQGKKRYSLYMPCPVVDIGLIQIRKTRITSALLVALQNGEVRTYNEKSLVRSRCCKEAVQRCCCLVINEK